MKQISVMMRMVGFAVLVCLMAAAASCSGDEGLVATNGRLTPSTSGDTTATDMTLTAVFANTRVGFDTSGHGYWHSGDNIAVSSATSKAFVQFENLSEDCAATATFKGKIAAADVNAETLVLYPYNAAHTQSTYNLPEDYGYTSVDEDYTAATGGTTNSFRMPLWAETNVGATIATEYGNHYTWAETATKSHYGYDNDSHFNFSKGTWSKYTTESGLITLEAADDAASVNWGKLCHMPTLAEITELLDAVNCTWTKTTETVSGKASNGFKVTSKTNGNSIFLPAAGYYPGYTTSYTGGTGFYWSSSLVTGGKYDDDAYMITFCNSSKMNYEPRSFGLSVRTVVNP